MKIQITDDLSPYLRAVTGNLENPVPGMKRAARVLDDPQSRTRPDRYLGLPGRAGEIKTWAPGYRRYMAWDVDAEGRITEYSARPYAPVLTNLAFNKVHSIMVEAALEADPDAFTFDFV